MPNFTQEAEILIKKGKFESRRTSLALLACVAGGFCLVMFMSCSRERKQILALAKNYENLDGASWEDRVGDIKKTMRLYENELEQKVKASEFLGEYYKTLAELYMEKKMYGEAVKNLDQAISYYPEKPILFYLAGVCEARTAKSEQEPGTRQERLRKAEAYYKRALSLNRNHGESLYGLSILYIFELNETLSAKPLLERLINNEPSHNDAKFLLARVYVAEGNVEGAVTLYDEIIKKSHTSEQKTVAEENKRAILEGAYGR